MLLLIHKDAEKLVKILKDETELQLPAKDFCSTFWELAARYPEEIIGWCEESLFLDLDLKGWPGVFQNELTLASFGINTIFLPRSIGYIDQLPFVNVSRDVKYPTWNMSSDVGGIRGETLLKFQELLWREQKFQRLINSIGKLGQQNGLLCYSEPRLIISESNNPKPSATNTELFGFVYSHYKTVRLFILFWCFIKYENSIPLLALGKAFFNKKYFRKVINFSNDAINPEPGAMKSETIDVIIPTFGRRRYLLQVLEDLKNQTLLPQRVIVVEQDPEVGSETGLPELEEEEWPFTVIHHFTHHLGACRARNLALKEVKAEWVFFADDDIRIVPGLLETSMEELHRLQVSCLNINCKQEGEPTVFKKIKQWGSFGSGTSIVKAEFSNSLRFDETFEHGFGEDQDYGVQLRRAGCDIVYHPELEILHLKAPIGGFREVGQQPWESEQPKPSPTLMAYIKKNFTEEQRKGYKTELFLRYYSKQNIKNPWRYFRSMRERWRKSEEWAEKIIRNNSPAKSIVS